MDCRLRMCSQIWLIALFMPALLWGHGKAADNGMQNDDDSRNGTENRNHVGGATTQQKSVDNSTGSFSGHVSVQTQNPVAENSTLETGAEGDASKSNTSRSGALKSSSLPRKGSGNGSAEIPANVESVGMEKADVPGFVEPDLTNETYNQVRAKKPSIPSRFDGKSGFDAGNENGDASQRMSVFKLLGLPTVVFGLLFFVMWGIISGRIQRIMF